MTEQHQTETHFSCFGEDCYLSRVGQLSIDANASAISGIVSIVSAESQTTNGQSMIERAEVLLPASSDDCGECTFQDGTVEKLTTAHIISIRGQIFSIETIGVPRAGFRKLTCKSRKREVANHSTLNGRL